MIEYVDYHKLKDFYSLSAAGKILGLNKTELRRECFHRDVKLSKNKSGTIGLSRSNFRYLHYELYHEAHRQQREENHRA